jgi:hypothetical protein
MNAFIVTATLRTAPIRATVISAAVDVFAANRGGRGE